MPSPYTIPFAPRYGASVGRIADLMRRQGDIAAQRAAYNGELWSNTLRDIALSVAAIPKMKLEDEERKYLQSKRISDEAYRQEQTQKLQRQEEAEKAEREQQALENMAFASSEQEAANVGGVPSIGAAIRMGARPTLALKFRKEWLDAQPEVAKPTKAPTPLESANEALARGDTAGWLEGNVNARVQREMSGVASGGSSDSELDMMIRSMYPGVDPKTLTRQQFSAAVTELARARHISEPGKPKPGDPLETVAPDYRQMTEIALLSYPGTRREPAAAMISRLAAAGDEEQLKHGIREVTIQGEPVDIRNQIRGRQATIASLLDTQQILREMKEAGVPTGFLVGTIEDVVRKVGATTDPRYVELANRLQGTLINYRRASTGVQFGEKESEQYQRMFPNYKNNLPVNEGLIRGLLREFRTYDNAYWTGRFGPAGARKLLKRSLGKDPTIGEPMQ